MADELLLGNTTSDGTETNLGNLTMLENHTYNTTVSMPERVIEATILTIICVLALVGNISLWIVVISSKHLNTTSNALVLSLSTADLLVSAVNMPVVIYSLAVGGYDPGVHACMAIGFLTMLTFVASVMSLGTISINRYILICHPSRFKTVYTRRNTALFIIGTWLLSFILASPPLIGWSEYAYIPNQAFCFCDWRLSPSYTVFMVLVCFGGPCSAMSFSYIRILQVVRASKRRIAHSAAKRNSSNPGTEENGNGNSGIKMGSKISPKDNSVLSQNSVTNDKDVLSDISEDSTATSVKRKRRRSLTRPKVSFKSQKKTDPQNGTKNNASAIASTSTSNQFLTVPGQRSTAEIQAKRAEKKKRQKAEELRLTLSLLVVILVFIICWFPFCVSMFINVFSSHAVDRKADVFVMLLGFANSCCNPLIYGLMNKKFKYGFNKLFSCRCKKERQDLSSSLDGTVSKSATNQQPQSNIFNTPQSNFLNAHQSNISSEPTLH